MSGIDNRGSEEQRIIYRQLCELFPTCDVIYEAVLPNGMRFDCFVKQMGIVVELDGVQHSKFTEHFHKDENGFLKQIFKDRKKDSIAEELGIKLVRIAQKDCPKTSEELKKILDSIPYPDAEYDYESIERKQENKTNQIVKEIRAKRYLEYKKQRGVKNK